MNIELKGTLKVIKAEEKINDSFSKKEIVITIDENTQYPQDIIVQALNSGIDLCNTLKMGDRVSATIDLRGKCSQDGRYFNQLILWKIEKI